MGIGHSRCRIGRIECALGCALTGNSNSVFSWWESGFELHIFPISIFLISATFRKESSNFSTRVSNPPFQFGAEGGALETWENQLFPHHFWRPLSSFSHLMNLFFFRLIDSLAGWLMSLPYWSLTSYLFPTPRLLYELTDVPALYSNNMTILFSFFRLFPTWKSSILFPSYANSYYNEFFST